MHNLLANEIALSWLSQTNPRIPVGMLHIPRKFFCRSTFHNQFRHDVGELILKSTNPTIGQNDIRIKDLTRFRIHAAWSDRSADVVVQPANEVIANVFRILFHVLTGFTVLLTNFDRVDDSNFSKRFVPVQDAFANKTTIANRSRVLDVENDRLFRRA